MKTKTKAKSSVSKMLRRIRKKMEARGIKTMSELARELGMHRVTIYLIARGELLGGPAHEELKLWLTRR